jgi:hypothetical protein
MATRSYALSTSPTDYLKVSDDKGLTWQTITPVGYPDINSINSIAVDPYNSYTALLSCGSGFGLWVTNDGGATFGQVSGTSGLNFESAYYIDSQTIIATGDQIYRSTNGGTSFVPSGVSGLSLYGLPAPIDYVIFGAYAIGFCAVSDKLYKSYDAGLTWAPANGDSPIVAGSVILGIRHLNDNDSVVVAVSGSGLYLSTDGGSTFSLTLALSLLGTSNFLFGNRWTTESWFITSNQQIYFSPNSTITWNLVNTYPNTTVAYQSIFGFNALDAIFYGGGLVLGASTGIYTTQDGGTNLNQEENYSGRFRSADSTYEYTCGECPGKLELNPQTGLCELVTNSGPLCPSGYTYDPITNTCVGGTTYYPKDIIFARDCSGSIQSGGGAYCDPAPVTQSEWNQMTLLQDDIITNISSEILSGDVQVGVVDWSTNASLTQGLTSTLLDIQNAICIAKPQNGQTNTCFGLCKAYNELLFGVNEDPTAEKIIILFTDGNPSGYSPVPCASVPGAPTSLTANAITSTRGLATAIKNQGVKIILVALGTTSDINNVYTSLVQTNPTYGDPVPSLDANGNLLYFNASFDNATTITDQIVAGITTTETLPVPACPDNCTVYVDPIEGTAYCQCTEIYLIPPCCYELTDCDGSAQSIITQTDLSDYVGQVIKIQGSELCWEITAYNDICPDNQDVIVTGSFASCALCSPKHGLYNCKDQDTVIYTQTDLSLYVGQTIQIAEYPNECWQVGPLSAFEDPAVDVTLQESFLTCAECDKPKYQLTNCLNDEAVVITDSDLSAYLNKVINVDGLPGICFSVSDVKCDCIKVTTNVNTYTSTSTTTINGRNQYFIDLGTEVLTLAWDTADSRWEIFNPDTDTLYAYSTIDVVCPFISYWILTEDAPFTNIIVSYCIDELTNITAGESFTTCEQCVNC